MDILWFTILSIEIYLDPKSSIYLKDLMCASVFLHYHQLFTHILHLERRWMIMNKNRYLVQWTNESWRDECAWRWLRGESQYERTHAGQRWRVRDSMFPNDKMTSLKSRVCIWTALLRNQNRTAPGLRRYYHIFTAYEQTNETRVVVHELFVLLFLKDLSQLYKSHVSS